MGEVRFCVKTFGQNGWKFSENKYTSFESAKRKIRKIVKDERSKSAGKHSSVTFNLSGVDAGTYIVTEGNNNIAWIKGVPKEPGDYLVYTKRSLRKKLFEFMQMELGLN